MGKLRTAAEIAAEKTADIPAASHGALNQRQFGNVQTSEQPKKSGLWQGFKELIKSFDEPIDPDFEAKTRQHIGEYNYHKVVMAGGTNPREQAVTTVMAKRFPNMGYPGRDK